eukprot:TRINITY_DN12281_c0_g1_i1.p1 TRINITY_DN12281_c0_g1~~TRINITY_DN12281_c0_g1_i1.p1  ORF type:complete len:785 (+),score=156.73 TRINITY_DN12281_c0_g1_i1:134-2356(+)
MAPAMNGFSPSSPEAFEAVVTEHITRTYRDLYVQYQHAAQQLHDAKYLRASALAGQDVRPLPGTVPDDASPIQGSSEGELPRVLPVAGEASNPEDNSLTAPPPADRPVECHVDGASKIVLPSSLKLARCHTAPVHMQRPLEVAFCEAAIMKNGYATHPAPEGSNDTSDFLTKERTKDLFEASWPLSDSGNMGLFREASRKASRARMKSRTISTAAATQDLKRSMTGNDAALAQVRARLDDSADRMGSWLRTLSNSFASPPMPQNPFLEKVVCTKAFESLSSLVISLNTIFIAYTSNYAMENIDNPETLTMQVIDIAFCAFYLVELMLRILVFKGSYLCSTEWTWNSLDIMLVAVSVQELIVTAGVSSSEKRPNMSFLRILRVMKMMKLFRVVRLLRMFRELRLIWDSIVGCLRPLFWATTLIVAVSFMVGVCFLQAATNYIREKRQELPHEDIQQLEDLWGTVQRSMLSLYKCVTGGADWGDVAITLVDIGMAYYLLFLLYILFYNCVIANTLTSLFVESTMMNADKDQQCVIQNALEQSDKIIDKLRDWFADVDADGSGSITYEEFCNALNNPRSLAFASTLEIGVTDLKQFFAALSRNGEQPVDLETFVVGCIKLRGSARSMDLMELMYFHSQAVQQAKVQQGTFQEFCLEKFDEMKAVQLQTAGFVKKIAEVSGVRSRKSTKSSSASTCHLDGYLAPKNTEEFSARTDYKEGKPATTESNVCKAASEKLGDDVGEAP